MNSLKGVTTVAISNTTKQTSLGEHVRVARSFRDRGLGLMFRAGLGAGTGLVIDPCSSIHTMWMRFPLDVLYMAADGSVLRVDSRMKPWRIGPLFVRGRYVIELPPGTIETSRTEAGDVLDLRPRPS